MRITRRHLDLPSTPEAAEPAGRRIGHLSVLLLAGFVLTVLLLWGGLSARTFRFERGALRGPVRGAAQFVLARVRAWTALGKIPALGADLAFEDYQRLVTQREQALADGANVVSEAAYVDARLTLGDQAFDTSLSLREGPAEPLAGGDRWPLQGVVVGDDALLGARAFRLVPADGGAPRAWGYLHALRRAGLPAAELRLVRLGVNGDPWGVYALEMSPAAMSDEGPGPVIVSFDPRAYFEAYGATGEFGMGSGIRYARIAARRGWGPSLASQAESFEDDPALASVHAVVVERFDAIAAGDLEPWAVFDVDAVGRHLALTTLWYGSPALDWRGLSLLHDPEDGDLTPVGGLNSAATGWESDPLGVLADPQIQRAYLRALQEVADAACLDALRAELEPLWKAQGWAASGLGSLDAMWDALHRNQAAVRRMLAPSRTLYADAGETGDVLWLRLRNVQPFPVEVLGLELGGEAFLPLQQAWIDAEDRPGLAASQGARVILRAWGDRMAPGVDVRVPLSALPIVMEGREDEIRVVTRLWGLDDRQVVMPVREPYSLSDRGF